MYANANRCSAVMWTRTRQYILDLGLKRIVVTDDITKNLSVVADLQFYFARD